MLPDSNVNEPLSNGFVEFKNQEGIIEKGSYKGGLKNGLWTAFDGKVKKYEDYAEDYPCSYTLKRETKEEYIERKYKEANDDEVKGVIKANLKSLATMVENKLSAGMDIISEQTEISILNSYMPSVLSEEQTRAAIKEVVDTVGFTSMKDMGKVMASLSAKFGDTIDKALSSKILKEYL